MKMIRHEDVGVDLPAGLGASLGEGFDEALVIRLVQADRFAPVAAIHDVVNRTEIFDSQLAGHDGRVAAPLQLTISRPLYGYSNPFIRQARLPQNRIPCLAEV